MSLGILKWIKVVDITLFLNFRFWYIKKYLPQPIDQEMIKVFKTYYLHRTFWQFIKATDVRDKSTIFDFGRIIIFVVPSKSLESREMSNPKVYEFNVIKNV